MGGWDGQALALAAWRKGIFDMTKNVIPLKIAATPCKPEKES